MSGDVATVDVPLTTAAFRKSQAPGDLVVLKLSIAPLWDTRGGAGGLVCVGTNHTAQWQHEFARSSFLASFSHELRYAHRCCSLRCGLSSPVSRSLRVCVPPLQHPAECNYGHAAAAAGLAAGGGLPSVAC